APKAIKPLPPAQDLVYLYDGSMAGFFCCVFRSVYEKEMPGAIWLVYEAQPTMYVQREIETEPDKAERVRRSIPEKIGRRAQELIEAVFLSCLEEKELAMLRFLLLGYQEGRRTLWLYGHPDVHPLLAAEKHLGGEVHLLKGFIRFSDYDGVLGATISPKNFVLPYLASHFAGRYSEERFIIFDKVHKAALIYEKGQSKVVPLEGIEFPEASEEEQQYRALWKRFYNTIAIAGRENPKCRRTHMPMRYWENMLEVSDLLEQHKSINAQKYVE
ncbi:TIGR03915 family putative DNA repair protein, partial [Ruminococcaceae bacterium OttesenSCG-928-D13]|nr:TIGR03915 family putative DNA repair protein [Ruminococcaceae bacterium OttesenSCG-928-D13]